MPNNYVPQTWDEYEPQYKAGLKLLIEKVMPDVDKIIDQKYHDGPIPTNIPKDVLTAAFDAALENKVKNDPSFTLELKQFLSSVNDMLRQWQVPRGDMSPQMRNRETLREDPNAPGSAPTQYAVPEWAKGMFDDVAADPKIRQAVEENSAEGLSADARNENKLQNRYTPQMQMKMDNLKAEMKKVYKMEAPQYVPKNRMNPG